MSAQLLSLRQVIADQWSGRPCTLDGQPAKITGRLQTFATVSCLTPYGPAVEFAWETVQRVMVSGGEFSSK